MPITAEHQEDLSNNMKIYFEYFDNELSKLIKNILIDFWGIALDIRLFAIELNAKSFACGNEYFVAQADVHSLNYSFRVSDSACEMLLTSTLGNNDEKFFDFSSLTELEGNILNNFANKVFKGLKDFILTPKEIKKMLENEEDCSDYINFGFVIKDKENKFEEGKIFLKLPYKVIKLPELEEKEGVLDTTKFRSAKTIVDIFVGKTRLTLDEINNIEKEDIVLLEKSNTKKMSVIYPTKIDFQVNPDPRLFLDNEEENNETDKDDIDMKTRDIWDNVQVDVCAKFPKVKMSLGELRDMTEGVVMELDSIYDNQVVLEVENRNVAKGELVIIGSKYGVKITEIFSQDTITSNESNEEEISSENNKDDFDVNDFEIEE